MTGKVVITVDKPKKYKNIAIGLYGAAKVHWTESDGNNTSTYSNYIKYVKEELVVWSLENSPTNNLPIGEHTFPFEFRLPRNIPNSFEGAYGHVRYHVGVTVRNGLLKLNHKAAHPITVKKRPDILRLFQNPKTVTTIKKLSLFWHKLGCITATCDLPCTGFSPGESIPFTIHVRNESSRNIHIKLSLFRKEKYIASGGRRNKRRSKITEVISPVIRAGNIQTIRDGLAIPTQAFATLLFQDCPCISAEYYLVITVKIPWSINKKMKVPVMIAHQPPWQESVQFSMQPLQTLSHDGFTLQNDFSNMGELTPLLHSYS